MRKSAKLGVLVLTVFFVAGAYVALSADSTRSSEPSPIRSAPSPQTIVFNRKLISTTHSVDAGVVTGGPGFVAIDSPLSFICPAGGCTVAAELNVQVGGASTTGNRFAICAKLDGAFTMQPGCPYQGIVPSDGTYVVGSFVDVQSGVTAGSHTLQSWIYTDNGADRAEYNVVYRLYKP